MLVYWLMVASSSSISFFSSSFSRRFHHWGTYSPIFSFQRSFHSITLLYFFSFLFLKKTFFLPDYLNSPCSILAHRRCNESYHYGIFMYILLSLPYPIVGSSYPRGWDGVCFVASCAPKLPPLFCRWTGCVFLEKFLGCRPDITEPSQRDGRIENHLLPPPPSRRNIIRCIRGK